MRSVIAALLSLTFAGNSAQALECVYFNKAQFGTVTTVGTQNGFMTVVYPAGGNPLPIKSVKLPGGVQVIGALPGNVPLSFIYSDKTNTVRTVTVVAMQYLTQPDAPFGKAVFYDAQHNVVTTGSISPTPPYQINGYFSPPFLRPFVQSDITFPKTLVLQFCVEPSDSAGMSVRQLIGRLRHR